MTDITEHEYNENHSFAIWNKNKCDSERNRVKTSNVHEEDYDENRSILIYEEEKCYNKRNWTKMNVDFRLRSYWKWFICFWHRRRKWKNMQLYSNDEDIWSEFS